MKYLRKFEEKYKEGDYVYLNIDQIVDNDIGNNIEPHFLEELQPYPGAIIMTSAIKSLDSYYNVKLSDGKNIGVTEDEIIRKLTQTEIEEYNMRTSVNKFNV